MADLLDDDEGGQEAAELLQLLNIERAGTDTEGDDAWQT